MLGKLWTRWQTWREDRAVARRPIRDDLWKRTLVRYPFLRRHDPADQARLRRLTSLFLDRKEFSALGGVKLTDDVVVAVAAQACLPVLRLGLNAYNGFLGVVLHPDQVLAPRSFTDDDGIVHEYEEPLAGEAVQGGPVMLSWRDVRTAGRSTAQGYNVVIHEFAHVLDMANGQADGVPPLPAGLPAREWQAVLSQTYDAFAAQVQAWEALPDEQADELELPLDPYGAQAPEEFFAVASEAFFVNPWQFQADFPALQALLVRYYRQDPTGEMPPLPVRD
jgi:Mlc titration factor MtfA (ptsG expression regulator)